MPFQIVCFFRLLKIKDEELENMNTSDLNINILLLGPKTKRQHLNKIQDAAATTPADLTWNHPGMFSVKTCQNKTKQVASSITSIYPWHYNHFSFMKQQHAMAIRGQ